MTKRLYLMRHGHASHEPVGFDAQRPLSDTGRADIAQFAQWFEQSGFPAPQELLVSSATRTQQTYELCAQALAPKQIAHLDDLYLAPEDELLRLVHAQPDDADCVMLIGHNPGLHDFASRLSAHESLALEGFPAGGVAMIETSAPSWGLVEQSTNVLRLFWAPERGCLVV